MDGPLLPAPLIGAEVDLRDYYEFPLQFERLFGSDTWIACDAEEKVAALQLWCKSWHQEPAGSLPLNDKILSVLAGYGENVKAWVKVKDHILAGWVACTDGRLYHPVVCEIAQKKWLGKKRSRAETNASRARQQRKRQRHAERSEQSHADVTRDTSHEEKGSEEKKKEDASASSARASPPRRPVEPDGFAEFWERCPHRVDKPAALKAFAGALRKTDFATLMAGLDRYIAAKPPDRSWCNPATFLNGERWHDEPAPAPLSGATNGIRHHGNGPGTKLWLGAALAVERVEREDDRRARDAIALPLLDG